MGAGVTVIMVNEFILLMYNSLASGFVICPVFSSKLIIISAIVL